jgi:hypothetical protein
MSTITGLTITKRDVRNFRNNFVLPLGSCCCLNGTEFGKADLKWRHEARYLMRPSQILAILLSPAASTVSVWMVTEPRPAFSNKDASLESESNRARGRLIFDAGDCGSCHAKTGRPGFY